MRKNSNLLGRGFVLATVDAILALLSGMLLFRHVPADLHYSIGMSMVLVTVLSLSMSGAYFHLLRKPLSWHQYSAGLAAVCAGISVAIFLRISGTTGVMEDVLLATAVLFIALLSVRVLMLVFYRSFAGNKTVWVIAEDLIAAARLADKVSKHACCYEVTRCSGPPPAQDIASQLQPFDAVLCTASLRSSLEHTCKSFGKELLVVPNVSDVLLYNASAHQLDDLLVLSMRPLRLGNVQRLVKRGCDIAGSLCLLVLSAPVMLALYVLIPLESRGGAIFRQERRGLDGRSFQMLKFRTMTADAEESCGPVLATREDPRVTRLGNTLRATRLDELPQLFNVLRGEMSLVGPRPEREFFAARFDRELPDFPLRTTVKPGLTGLAQVWGTYATTPEDKLRLDLMYIANYSLLLDLNLLLQTIRVVFYRNQSVGLDPSRALDFGFSPVSSVDKPTEREAA